MGGDSDNDENENESRAKKQRHNFIMNELKKRKQVPPASSLFI